MHPVVGFGKFPKGIPSPLLVKNTIGEKWSSPHPSLVPATPPGRGGRG